MEQEEVGLLIWWQVLRKHAVLLMTVCVLSILGAFVVSLRVPKVYEATAALLAPKESQGSSERLALLLTAPGVNQLIGGMLPSMARNRDVFVSILKSRTMAQDVVERFRLKERYQVRYLEDAINSLKDDTRISISKEGAILVKVEATDPQLAADIANFYVSHLDRLLVRFSTGEASRDRAFIEEQLAKAERSLREAEEALRRFQEKNRAVVLPEQSKAAVEAAARLKGEIMASEVQLEVMRSFATEANPEVVNLKRKIGEMKRQLSRMQYGAGWELPPEGHNPGQSRKEIYVPFAKVPEIGLELARLTREVKVQETVYTLLTQQLEQAKIAEARDFPTVQILDRAVPAERPSKPKIRFNMAVAGATSLFLGVLLAFFLESLKGKCEVQGSKSQVQSSGV